MRWVVPEICPSLKHPRQPILMVAHRAHSEEVNSSFPYTTPKRWARHCVAWYCESCRQGEMSSGFLNFQVCFFFCLATSVDLLLSRSVVRFVIDVIQSLLKVEGLTKESLSLPVSSGFLWLATPVQGSVPHQLPNLKTRSGWFFSSSSLKSVAASAQIKKC